MPHRRAANKKDKSSQSNPEKVKSIHIDLNLKVDFASSTLSGWVEHTMEVMEEGVMGALFDSSNIKVTRAEVNGAPAGYKMLPKHDVFGTPIQVRLPPVLQVGSKIKVKMWYATSPSASACQWLPPALTAGKTYPYLFTQSQAIHARSIIPCQDAPAVKVTYRAWINAPSWATVLMSALRAEEEETSDKEGKTYVWQQPVPIPSYLIALAVGQLEARDISSRCRIWAEPSMVDACHYEFAQTEEFLQHAEALTSPYVWTRYDLLCLPPSFPYGGMENPCLTFVTPTLLAGDRSLADVVAHEISHSWSGNLVTNATWEHFWLNEGWTMWLQRKIMTRIHKDPRFFDLDALIGWKHLGDDVLTFGADNELTALVPPLDGVDPDTSFSSVPYEKGFNLLYTLERLVGTLVFEAFAKHYFDKYKYSIVTTTDFRQTFIDYLNTQPGINVAAVEAFPWENWFFQPGLPPCPNYDKSLASAADQLARAWFEAKRADEAPAPGDFLSWTTTQKLVFLERLMLLCGEKGRPIPVPVLEVMDATYNLSSSRNAEIRFRWITICMRAGAAFILGNAVDFISSQGRMKFVRPLYREMNNSTMAKELALETFKKNQPFYHPICRKMVAQDLGLSAEVEEKEEDKATPEVAEEGDKAGMAGSLVGKARKLIWTSMALWLVAGVGYAVLSRLRRGKR